MVSAPSHTLVRMTADLWHPLSDREAGTTGLREGVPDFLAQPLSWWIYEVLEKQSWIVERIRVMLALEWSPEETDDAEEAARAFLALETPADGLLDIADAALRLLPAKVVRPLSVLDQLNAQAAETKARRRPLQQLLDDARSVYCVKPDGSGLMRRSSIVAAGAVNKAVQSAEAAPDAGSAAVHLRAAWEAVYALHPDPVRGYSEAVKAVEAAAHAVAQPTNAKATLGTMTKQVREHPDLFRLVLADGQCDVGTVAGMMAALWVGQTSRHGGMQPTRPETLEEALAAVSLAACLVEWFTTGAVIRR